MLFCEPVKKGEKKTQVIDTSLSIEKLCGALICEAKGGEERGGITRVLDWETGDIFWSKGILNFTKSF